MAFNFYYNYCIFKVYQSLGTKIHLSIGSYCFHTAIEPHKILANNYYKKYILNKILIVLHEKPNSW